MTALELFFDGRSVLVLNGFLYWYKSGYEPYAMGNDDIVRFTEFMIDESQSTGIQIDRELFNGWPVNE
jgi:hypothetical protein